MGISQPFWAPYKNFRSASKVQYQVEPQEEWYLCTFNYLVWGEELTRTESLTKKISSEDFWLSRHHRMLLSFRNFWSNPTGWGLRFQSSGKRLWHLQELLKAARVTMQSAKASKLEGFKFTSDTWTHEINSAFKNVKSVICESIQLSRHDPEKLMCIFPQRFRQSLEDPADSSPKGLPPASRAEPGSSIASGTQWKHSRQQEKMELD